MPGPGQYRPDPTEGITRIDDLPRTKVACRSRNYRRRPCPRCGHSSYRDRLARRNFTTWVTRSPGGPAMSS